MTLVTMVTTNIKVNLFYIYFRFNYKMHNSQYQMLHMSITQNNFLNTNLSTLTVQKIAFICVGFDVVSSQNASFIDKIRRSKLILNTLLFFKCSINLDLHTSIYNILEISLIT